MMNKKLKLYLDDLRTPLDDTWIVVRNYTEFVDTITIYGIEPFDTISFDHDLGDTAMIEYFNNTVDNYTINYDNIKEKTGMDCAKWLVTFYLNGKNKDFVFPQIYSHSANPIGAANIIGYINNFLKNIRQPQTSIRVRIDHKIENHGS